MTLKYFKRLKIYKNYKASNTFYPETLEAWSYDWWQYLAVIKGKLVFNDYTYSNCTSKHQNDLRGLLRELRIKVDVCVEVAGGLQSSKSEWLEPYYKNLLLAEIRMKRKGASYITKNNSLAIIKQAKSDIKNLRSLGATFTKQDQKELFERLVKSEKDRIEYNRKTRVSLPSPNYDKMYRQDPYAIVA
jgi:hypothetical protein